MSDVDEPFRFVLFVSFIRVVELLLPMKMLSFCWIELPASIGSVVLPPVSILDSC